MARAANKDRRDLIRCPDSPWSILRYRTVNQEIDLDVQSIVTPRNRELFSIPKIYTLVSSEQLEDRKNLIPPFQYHWRGIGTDESSGGNGNSVPSFKITSIPDESDWFALPMHWSYYLWNGKIRMKEAFKLADLAAKYGRRVIVWYKGDLIPRVPFENALLFLPGPRRSKMNSGQRACPVFVSDPVQRMPELGSEPSKKFDVAFCWLLRVRFEQHG